MQQTQSQPQKIVSIAKSCAESQMSVSSYSACQCTALRRQADNHKCHFGHERADHWKDPSKDHRGINECDTQACCVRTPAKPACVPWRKGWNRNFNCVLYENRRAVVRHHDSSLVDGSSTAKMRRLDTSQHKRNG